MGIVRAAYEIAFPVARVVRVGLIPFGGMPMIPPPTVAAHD
jgi:hypothetical protein